MIEDIQKLALECGAELGQNWRIPEDALRGLTDAASVAAVVERIGKTQGQRWILPLDAIEAIVVPAPPPPPPPPPPPAKKVTKKKFTRKKGER